MLVADIKAGDDKITLTSAWGDQDLIKKIPGARWNSKDKVWTLPLSWVACLQLRGIFKQRLAIGEGLRAWAKAEKEFRVDMCMSLRTVTDWPEHPDFDWTGKLYGFQRAGVEFMLNAGSCLLADEMGTGKTIQALSVLRELHEEGVEPALPALLVCPNTVKGNWKRETEKWFPDATPYVVAGTAVQRRKILAAAAADATALVIINFESVRAHSRLAGFGSLNLAKCAECEKGGTAKTASCEVHPRELNAMKFAVCIVDEAHRMKDPNAKQTRAVWAASTSAGRRIAMTGTPVAHNAADVWSIMHFVSPTEFPTKSKFVDRYCQTSFNEWGYLEIGGLNERYKHEFYNVLYPRMRRMPKALVLSQLPPKVHTTRLVTLTKDQQKMYDQMSAGLVTRTPDGTLMVAKENIAANTRLLQFSSATMREDGVDQTTGKTKFTMCDPSPKLDAMMDVVDEIKGKQLVIAFQHKQLLKLAAQRLKDAGVKFAELSGDTPQWQRDKDVQDFQAGKIDVFLFTIQAGGVGITLNAADTILFVQRSWSMIENKQAVDRVHRIGSEKFQQINVIDLVAEGTIEEHQISVVVEKEIKEQEVIQDSKTLEMAGAA